MAVDFHQLKQSIHAKQYAPVYFLMGEEPYFIDYIIQKIENEVLNESEKSFNQTLFYGKDTDVPTVLNAARRFPMLSDRQVVIVKEAQELKDFGREDGQKMLMSYLKNPLASTILVFGFKYKNLDKRTQLYKEMDKWAMVLESKKLYDNKLPEWIKSLAAEKGFHIEDRAAQMLTDHVGNDLSRLANEIDKITINLIKGETIVIQHIQKFVGISKDFNVFELQNAIGNRNVAKAMQIATYLDNENRGGNPKFLTVLTLFSFFQKILMVHGSKDHSQTSLASLLKVNPFFVKDYSQAASNYSLPKTIRNIHHIKQADLQCKGIGSTSDEFVLRELVFKLVHKDA